jgi:HEPN domain-containing protein
LYDIALDNPVLKYAIIYIMATNVLEYWVNSSDDDFRTMEHLYKSRDYTWALFMGHLVIEKLLKAHYVKCVDKNVPFTHDLLRLAQRAGLPLNENQKDFLDMVTTFNINARYDDYKMRFHKKCTKIFTAKSVKEIKEFRIWVKATL